MAIKSRLWFSAPPKPQASLAQGKAFHEACKSRGICSRCTYEKPSEPIKLNDGLCPICDYDGPTVVYIADPFPMTVYHHKKRLLSSVPFWC